MSEDICYIELVPSDCEPEYRGQFDCESTKGIKDDEGKPDLMLVPIKGFAYAVEAVRQYGKKKYPDVENWKRLDPIVYWKAFERHVIKSWNDPNSLDEESGLPHSWHAAFNLACWLELNNKED